MNHKLFPAPRYIDKKEYVSQCIRCGKDRIKSKTWTEIVNTMTTTYISYICPDPKCQKLVDKMLLERKNRLDDMKKQSLERRKQNSLKRKKAN